VSSIAEIQGKVRESPPSLMSKPLEIPAVEEEEWNMGEILDKVFAHGLQNPSMPSPRVAQENHRETSGYSNPPPVIPMPPQVVAPEVSSGGGGQTPKPNALTSTSASVNVSPLPVVSKERETVVVVSYWDEVEDERDEATIAAAKQRQREQQRLFEEEAVEKLRVEQLLAEMREKKQPIVKNEAQVDSGENGSEDCVIS
jgi:hypothetical protein